MAPPSARRTAHTVSISPRVSEMSRNTGTVKWFSQEKGFGFITRDDGPDVFVHHTSLPGTGFRKLDQGERVEFDVIEEPKGMKAQNVTRMEGAVGDAQPRASQARGGWNRGGDGHRGADTSGGARADTGRSGGWNRERGAEGWGARGGSRREW
jgi:CspA family cold shock protein